MLVSEIRLEEAPAENFRMIGAGVAIVNPPWPVESLDALTQSIASRMPVKTAGETFWLDNQQINPETGLVGT